MNFAPIDLAGGGTALNFLSANPLELEAKIEAARAAAVLGDPTVAMGWLALSGAAIAAKITQAVIDGYTLLAGADSAGASSGFRFCNITLMQKPAP